MEEMTRTARILLLPDDIQRRLLSETVERYREACIYAGNYIYEHQELRRIHLHKNLYPVLRDPETFGLPSQMAESVIRTATQRERALIQIHRQWVRPDFRRGVCSLVWARDYKWKEEAFSIRTLKERIQIPYQQKGMREYFDGTWRFGKARLLEQQGKWYLHIAAIKAVDSPEITGEIPCVVGCDFGINFLVTAYDSEGKTKFFSGKAVKQHRATYENNVQELRTKKTASARKRLQALAFREHSYLQNINHETAKQLVESYPAGTVFVIERGNQARRRQEKAVSVKRLDGGSKEAVEVDVNWAFSDLRQKLIYKAQERGGSLIEVDPSYSSQKCPKCGRIRKRNRNKRTHTYECDRCGYTSNDDRIGAMNLYEKGLAYLRTVGMEHAPCQGAQPAVPGCNVESPPVAEEKTAGCVPARDVPAAQLQLSIGKEPALK